MLGVGGLSMLTSVMADSSATVMADSLAKQVFGSLTSESFASITDGIAEVAPLAIPVVITILGVKKGVYFFIGLFKGA